MPTIIESQKKIIFEHVVGEPAGVKTQIIKTLRARSGGKVTVSQQLTEGEGLASLWLGSSSIHNPESQDVVTILEGTPATSELIKVLENDTVMYPFLVVSMNFIDEKAAKVEVEVTLFTNPMRGR